MDVSAMLTLWVIYTVLCGFQALARNHSVIVIDAEHGAITIDQIALCLEVRIEVFGSAH